MYSKTRLNKRPARWIRACLNLDGSEMDRSIDRVLKSTVDAGALVHPDASAAATSRGITHSSSGAYSTPRESLVHEQNNTFPYFERKAKTILKQYIVYGHS